MINIVVNVICSILCSITIVYVSNILMDIDYKNTKIKALICITAISIITFLSAQITYNAESILFKITLCIMVFQLIYNKSIYKTIITIFMSILLLSAADITATFIFINFISVEEMRGIWYWILICNTVVYVLNLILINIPIIKIKLKNFIKDLNEEGKLPTIFIIVLSVIVIIYILYNISINYELSDKYIINVVIAVTYFVIIIIFLREKSEYNRLMKQYDTLFEYFKELEDSIDDISLTNHEYKNQLSILKNYIKNNNKKEAIKYINDIIKEANIEDKTLISELKYIPKGGIKGLLYYKIITAKNKNITMVLDVNKQVTKKLEKLSYEENKIISKILGVYIDNCIEAMPEIENKIINIEIYNMQNKINIVISNPFSKEKLDINKISKKGYTTKGKGHGKGLYLVNKIINRSKKLNSETTVINNYFIQKLIIHLE